MRRPLLLATCAAALLTVGSASAAAPAAAPAEPDAHRGHGIIDVEHLMEDEVDCGTAQLLGPEATGTGHLTGGDRISLDALVLVDVAEGAGIAATKDKRQRAAREQALFAEMADRIQLAKESYAPLGIDLRLDRYALLAPQRTERTDNAEEIIELAKKQYGGVRPAGVDVVYVLTDLDIQVPGIGNAVAGLADCIGGVANPGNAFAVGETQPVGAEDSGALFGLNRDFTAKVLAHEVGHLMGAHHHYQECGVPAVTALQSAEPGPCSIMTNLVDFTSVPFSQLNGVVVRGHAEQFAS